MTHGCDEKITGLIYTGDLLILQSGCSALFRTDLNKAGLVEALLQDSADTKLWIDKLVKHKSDADITFHLVSILKLFLPHIASSPHANYAYRNEITCVCRPLVGTIFLIADLVERSTIVQEYCVHVCILMVVDLLDATTLLLSQAKERFDRNKEKPKACWILVIHRSVLCRGIVERQRLLPGRI